MGLTLNKKVELASYQLKEVTQAWYTQLRDNRALRAGPITWEVFRRDFLDILFHREKREANVEILINLCQGGMSVKE